ncbi:MAG: PQQ-binding-like beta-propeller repeat protein [Candidatus Bathyarchaeia archaeon]
MGKEKMLKVFSGLVLLVLLVGTLAVASEIQPASADGVDWWPMFHHDPSHTGTSNSTAPTTNNTLWTYTTGSGVGSSPAVVGDMVYIGSGDGNVYCLNAGTGALVWNYTTVRGTVGNAVFSSPAVVGGLVYVGSQCYVYCLNAASGALVWYYTTGGSVLSSPAVVGGLVYVGSYDDNVYCLNATNGAFVWSYTIESNEVWSSPAVVGGLVYVGSYGGYVYCLNATTGALVWRYTTGGYVDSSPAVVNGVVYIGSENGKIYAFGSVQSSTSVTCSPNPAHVGSSVTCTATVSGSNPTGTITWSTSSIGGSFSQSVCTLSNGTCSTTYTDNFTGSVTIAAYYSGDSNNMPSSGSTTLLVTSAGPVYYSQNYTSVQAAINAAAPGGTVVIAPGFYTESLALNKTLTIIGEKDPPVFGGGASGIYLTLGSGASGSTVTGIEITNWAEGILVVNASNVRIYCNIMASMGGSGVVLEGSNAAGNVVFDNIFQDTPTPINLTASASGNTIYGNMITSQTGVTLNIAANGNVVYGNSISGSQILLNMTNSNANVFYHNNFMAAVQLTVLVTGSNTWDNAYPSGGNYWSNYNGADLYSGPYQNLPGSDGIGDTPYTIGSNTDHYPLMKPYTAASGHCVAVISVVAAKTVIGQGFNCNLTVCAADTGEYNETFSVTAYANATGVGTQQVSGLNASCLMVLRFAWNTVGLAYGNYTVSAYAQPVAGQTDMSGNDFTLGTVKVTISGDINGDFKVSLSDLSLLAKAYGTTPGQPKWNANADINNDGKVSLSDLSILAKNYGKSVTP